MPYHKFDEGSLEPRFVRENLTHYVETLKPVPRRRDKAAPSPLSKPSIAYPRAIIPSVHHKKKQKKLYCQHFARAFDRFYESPSVYDESLRKPLPPLLSLPAELRQQILDLVLDDNEVLFPRPNSTTRTLALSCKTFAEDVREVNKLWKARENAIREATGFDRKGMKTYMEDLLRPLASAAEFHGDLLKARAVSDAQRNRKRDNRLKAKKSRRI